MNQILSLRQIYPLRNLALQYIYNKTTFYGSANILANSLHFDRVDTKLLKFSFTSRRYRSCLSSYSNFVKHC